MGMMRRWVLICAYNRADNNPLIEHYHPQYTPLQKVSNSQVKECTLGDSTEDKWCKRSCKEACLLQAKGSENSPRLPSPLPCPHLEQRVHEEIGASSYNFLQLNPHNSKTSVSQIFNSF